MPNSVLAELLAEGLDLCVRARKLDDQADALECTTAAIWLLDQYDKDLADWEKRSREALVSLGG